MSTTPAADQPRDAAASVPGEADAPLEDPPPILGTWRRVYAVVLGALAVYVALFAALTAVWR